MNLFVTEEGILQEMLDQVMDHLSNTSSLRVIVSKKIDVWSKNAHTNYLWDSIKLAFAGLCLDVNDFTIFNQIYIWTYMR